jgi:hypothetical protein
MQVREATPRERERIEKYLLLDERYLFSLIPPYLAEYGHTAFSPDGQEEAGKAWFGSIRGSLERILCND